MSHVIGIDLGTSNTCVSILEEGQPKVLENAEGRRTTPSMVAYTSDGKRLIGQAAKRQMITNPQNTLFAIKRLIGRRYDDPMVQDEKNRIAFEIIESDMGDAWVKLDTIQMSPSQVSSMILQKMKQTAETYLGQAVEQAVITVPAYFNEAQRQATRDAGRIAGLSVLRIIHEPTAAALAFGIEKSEGKTIAVYDLGGSTFDISILTVEKGVFHVKATHGDTALGGMDFDHCLMDYVLETFENSEGVDLSQNKAALQRIKEATENARIELSETLKTEINLPFIHMDNDGPKHLAISITRSKLESLVEDLIQKTLTPCQTAMAGANLEISQIDEVILVGGMTRMPKIRQVVCDYFGKEPHLGTNPDLVVSMGAAIQGGMLKGEINHIELQDVTTFSLGIQTHDGGFSRIIHKNATLPCEGSKLFTTIANFQKRVTVSIAQGEEDLFSDNTLLGTFDLEGIPLTLQGKPKIEVTFSIDLDGQVQVSAKEQHSGHSKSLKLHVSGGLEETQIQQMTQEAAIQNHQESQELAILEGSNEAESLINEASQFLQKQEQTLTIDTTEQLLYSIDTLQAVIEAGEDIKKLASQTQDLQKTLKLAYQESTQAESVAANDGFQIEEAIKPEDSSEEMDDQKEWMALAS